MRQISFTALTLLSILALISPRSTAAQTLFIDENGAMYVSGGAVLGEGSDKESGRREERRSPASVTAPSSVQAEPRQDENETENEVHAENGKLDLRLRVKTPEKGKRETERGSGEEQVSTGAASPSVDRIRIRRKDEVELTAGKGNEVEIRKGNVEARAALPVSINSDNELVVTTPAGKKTVSVLPDAAVAGLLSRGVVSSVAALTGSTATAAGAAVGTAGQRVELTSENGVLQYKVTGTKDVKLFGFLPITAPVEARVSAETGVVSSVTQPFYLDFFGFLFR